MIPQMVRYCGGGVPSTGIHELECNLPSIFPTVATYSIEVGEGLYSLVAALSMKLSRKKSRK